jgi:hypothetical protein
LILTLFHGLHALQVSCERFDAKALFKKWDSLFITLSSSFMAYGSTEEKAVSRALGRGSSAEAHTVMPIAGCTCTAAAYDGKPHAMFVNFPAMHGAPEQCFAFATSAARDSFMRAVQSKSILLAAPSTSAPTHVASEAQNTAEGDELAEVTCPTI